MYIYSFPSSSPVAILRLKAPVFLAMGIVGFKTFPKV